MADEDEESSRPAIPAWQNAQSEPSAPSPPVEVQATSSSSDSISSSRDKEDEGEGEYTTAEDTSNEDTRFKDTADEVKAEVKAETEKESEHSEDEDNLTVARRFLSDPSVQSSSLASKLKFLRDKGLSESTIQTLLPAATVQEQEDVIPGPNSLSTSFMLIASLEAPINTFRTEVAASNHHLSRIPPVLLI